MIVHNFNKSVGKSSTYNSKSEILKKRIVDLEHELAVAKAQLNAEEEKQEVIGENTGVKNKKCLSELRLLNAQKVAKIGSWDFDIKNEQLIWSPETYNILGLCPETVQKPTFEFFLSKVHPDDKSKVEQAKDEAIRTRTSLIIDHKVVLPDGKIRYVRERGELSDNLIGEGLWLTGTVQDITEQRKVEIEKNRLLNILQCSLNEVYIFNSIDFKFEYVNGAAISNLGYQKQDLLVMTPLDLIEPGFQEDLNKALLPLFNGEKEKIIFETKFVRSDKSLYPVEVHLQWVNNEERPVFLAYVVDISAQKKVQNELATFFKFSPDMLCIAGTDGFFRRVNPAFSRILEYSIIELLEKPWLNFIHPDDIEKTMEEWEKLSQGSDIAYFENRFITKSGKVKWLAWTSTKMPGDDLTLAVAKDITEKKKMEEDLLSSNQRINNILESITDGFFTVEKDWTVTYWNKEAERMLPISREKILGKKLWDVYEDSISLKFYSELHKVLEENTPVHFEEYLPSLETWFEVSAYPSENGLSIYFKDVSERIKSQNEVRIAKERYDWVLKATNDAIWDFDFKTEEIHWGEGLKTLFGHELGKSGFSSSYKCWEEHIHPDDLDEVCKTLLEILYASDANLWQQTYRFKKADGTYAYVQDKGFIIRNEDGEPIRILGAKQDISDDVKKELALKELNDQVQKRAEQLAASNLELEQFAYIASHDLQEPLRMVTGFLTQLEKKYADKLDDKARQYIFFATDGARRMRKIILELLDYSRVGRVDYAVERVDMGQLLKELVQLNRRLIEDSGAEITWQGLPEISVAKTPMLQLLQNLISNAIKYQKPGQKAQVSIGTQKKNTCWEFWVKDNGIGIEPMFFEKVFILFQRLHAKDEYSGTGIGLAICKKIIDSLNGRIWVESVPGQGSTFYFTIPV